MKKAVLVAIMAISCSKLPPKPPPTQTSDYINLARVAELSKEFEDFPITWQGWRDPEYVSIYCAWGCKDGARPRFSLTKVEMHEFAMMGKELDGKRNGLIRDLPVVNRRCEEKPEFCGRSNVRKTRVGALREEIESHLKVAEELREAAQKDPIRELCPYDSIRGWCNCWR